MTLFVATSNPGKLRDFAAAAATYPAVVLQALPGLDAIAAPPEDADSFRENAVSKARVYSLHAPGLLVLADDSGLEVDALGGAPGVRSARFADVRHYPIRPGSDPNSAQDIDRRNNSCLLDALVSTREAQRTARYRCVLAAARDGVLLATGEGTVEGEILAVPRGNAGFGYDPLFLLPDEGLTMAELPVVTKLGFSHRGRALRRLLDTLPT